MTTYILYDRYFAMDEKTGEIKTYWRALGNKYNSCVQLHETNPVQTLNYFNQKIASLYLFCKPTQCSDFEKFQLTNFHKQFGNNIKIFKFQNQITISLTMSTLNKNLDNIQTIFMMHTRLKSNLDVIAIDKEQISSRIVYKINFNNDKIRQELITRIKLFNLTTYPDIEMFIPFDDECELILNYIFQINYNQDNNSSIMTLIPNHLIDFINLIETFHGLIQLVNSRNAYQNIMIIENREPINNIKIVTDLFLENVPVIDIFIGRIYENEQCIEFNSFENEITFIMIKMYIFKQTQYIVLVNSKFQKPLSKNFIKEQNKPKLNNFIFCDNEKDLLKKFCNLYTHGLIFKIVNMDVHFILCSQRYKSNSYIILNRIISNDLWSLFSSNCLVSEDGKIAQFNRNSIVIFDDMDKSSKIITNYKYINNNSIYLPELYGDSTSFIDVNIQNHLMHIKQSKESKYIEIKKQINEKNKMPEIMTLYDMISKIFNEEEEKSLNDFNLILESIIELSNQVRVPITMLYSMSLTQIAYRLIFYTYIRNGIFPIIDNEMKIPYFRQENDDAVYETNLNCIKNLKLQNPYKIFQKNTLNENTMNFNFQNLIKKYIPLHMKGNLVENYFNFFTPSKNHLPIISSLVDNESDLLANSTSVNWSRCQLFSDKCIVSFDFSLFYSSIMAIFGIDFNNCSILFGFELKSFFINIYPNEEIFNENQFKYLQLPHLFLMDNDTLEIINITSFQDINSKFKDQSVYIVIMRFLTSNMMQKFDKKYKSLSNFFHINILNMQKYRIRIMLHKNILNSICGMLNAYNINTVILYIVNALSRKIMLWTVDNCLHYDKQETTKSFLEHQYNSIPPKNLISIETDSFTFVYNLKMFNYDDENNINMELKHVEHLKENILTQLCNNLTEIVNFDKESIKKIFNLKLNFITGNLFYINNHRYFYMSINKITKKIQIESNEKNNRTLQKALIYLNMDEKLLKNLKHNRSIRMFHLKRCADFCETRNFLLWYLFEYHRKQNKYNIINENLVILNELRILDEFIDNINYELQDVDHNINNLISIIKNQSIMFYFINILSRPSMNLYFKQISIPEKNLIETIQLPSDKKTLIINCILIFFKLYKKYLIKKK